VTDFWTGYQPGMRDTEAELGSPEFFAETERARYERESHIPGIVRFDEWAGKDVLEVGCGIGTDGIQFARAGARYTGLDRSPTALEQARRRFELEGLAAEFRPVELPKLDGADEAFDLVYSHGVIHHIEQTAEAVEEFRRVLRPGGTALVMLYHRGSLNYRLSILVVRRALAGLLLSQRAGRVVQRATGEDPAVIEGHRELLREHGIGYLTDTRLFLSNNTDGPGNPLSKVYSRREAEQLFSRFSSVTTEIRYLNARLYPGGARLDASALARRWGWHLYVRAVR
jgi:ubiquinone/menaquinone biosynthesis C-methylase UbiE